MILGALFAAACYVWLSGRLRSVAPDAERVAGEARRVAADLSERLRAAWRDGWDEMERREDELRRELLGTSPQARG